MKRSSSKPVFCVEPVDGNESVQERVVQRFVAGQDDERRAGIGHGKVLSVGEVAESTTSTGDSRQVASAMRILTVRPPWAQAIVAGAKDVENRTWSTDHRGPIAVHAGLRFDTGAWKNSALTAWMDNYWGLTRETYTGEMFRGGAIIGVVDLVDVHRWFDSRDGEPRCQRSGLCSPWAEAGAFHLVLANPRPLAEPIPYRGALGLRKLDAKTTARILEAIA